MIVSDEEVKKAEYESVPVSTDIDYIFRNICPSVSAVYHQPDLELNEDANNPMILALPPFGDMKSIAEGMSIGFAIPHLDSYRKLPLEQRFLATDRISNVLVSTAPHIKMMAWLYIALRHRYRGLIPTRSLKKLAQRNYTLTQHGKPRPICAPGDSHAECMTVFGISGSGKTTLVKMVLSTLPMIVEHRRFQDVETRFVQVVWVLISCPPNGSVLTLMKGILHWFDLHLGTGYVSEVRSRANTADYILKVDDVLRRHMVGVLVIDEIQFALNSAEKVQLMGFLTNLLNSNHCTFILLGTPDARRYIVKSLRNARRIVSGGFIALDPSPVDEEWVRIARAITRIDFLPNPPLNPAEIMSILRHESAGSPAFAKLAWKLTQFMGLRAGEKSVTPALIRTAVKDGFGPVQGLLEALRVRDYAALARCEDLAVEEVDAIRDRVALERERRRLRTVLPSDEFISTCVTCVAMLTEMGRTQIEAESLVRRILSASPGMSPEDVIRRVLTGGESSVDSSSNGSTIKRKSSPKKRESAQKTPVTSPRKQGK